MAALAILAPAPALAGVSNCCYGSGGQGCDDAECTATVCAEDAFCCDVEWDGICAGLAEDLCGGLCPASEPEPSICRGAGFWSTHAGNQRGNTNMVQTLLDEVGCLEVCGEVIDETTVNSADSAEEGFCVAPKSSPQVRLARFLLTQAMNCIVSTGSPDCDPEAWSFCNAACADGTDHESMSQCSAYLDCQSEGGYLDEGGNCITGICQLLGAAPEGDGGQPCGATLGCPDDYTCVPTEGCDDAALVNEGLGIDWTDDESNSSSDNNCKRAIKTRCAIVGPNETACTAEGNESEDPETCNECTEGFVCGAGDPVGCSGSSGGPFGCNCFSTAEGGTACAVDQLCDSIAPCSTTEDCAEGEVCAVDTCCSLGAPQPEGGISGYCFPVGETQVCEAPPLLGKHGLSGPTGLSVTGRR